MAPSGQFIDPRKLMYFSVIVQHRSMGKAAKALGISQPALSMSMVRFEQEVGLPLLIRGNAGVEATEAGELIIRHARQIVTSLLAADAALFGESRHQGSVLHFGCLPTLAGSVIPQAIRKWRKDCSDLDLHVTERPQNELLWGLLNRDFDFAVGMVDVDNHAYGLRQRVLFRERLHVVARRGHPLLDQPAIELADLVRFPWVSPTTGWRNTALEHILEPAGLTLQHRVTVCSSISLLKSLIVESDQLALLPAHAVQTELESGKLCLLPFNSKDLERSIAVFLREGATISPEGEDLLGLVREQGRLRYVREAGETV
jgi:DNA-binding transcriptional LysR family regulator